MASRISLASAQRSSRSTLAAAAQQPALALKVLRFAFGAAPGLDGHFVLLSFLDPENPPVIYEKGLFGDLYLESRE
jgi:hypothetical protein